MTLIGLGINEYGTAISRHICSYCKRPFTVCPPANENWGGCLSPDCESYDINRDVDALLFFGCKLERKQIEGGESGN